MHEREPANKDELTIDSRTGRLFYSSNDQESKILSDIKSIPAKQIKYFCKCESLGVNMNKDIRVALSFFDHRKTRKLTAKLGIEAVWGLLRLWAF
ncbi:MAG TPA: hypothetical protein DHV25_03105, partial [Candidatus Kerfeldbacteria bacterium]|nr:hypothetical protein [Candidatus Kerfeldbacteria bacterium]